MNNQKAIKMLAAKIECMQQETSGTNIKCNSHNCDNCELCYTQGTTGEQIEALNKAISALQIEYIKINQIIKNSMAKKLEKKFKKTNVKLRGAILFL